MNEATPELLVLEIEALIERNRTSRARDRLQQALTSYPNHPELLLQSAWVDFMEDRNQDALATVRQVLVQEPENQLARFLLFKLLAEDKKLAEAEKIIVELLREEPEHAPYYGQYAWLMLQAAKFDKAHALASEGWRNDPDDVDCLIAHALCDFIEQPSGATSQALQQLLVHHPQSLQTMALIMVALEDRGDHRAALRIAQEMVRAQPDNRAIIEAAAEMKALTHWSMLPLWPMQRWGWAASIALWFMMIVTIRVLGPVSPGAVGILAICFLAYVVYSWVWPPILRRWIIRV